MKSFPSSRLPKFSVTNAEWFELTSNPQPSLLKEFSLFLHNAAKQILNEFICSRDRKIFIYFHETRSSRFNRSIVLLSGGLSDLDLRFLKKTAESKPKKFYSAETLPTPTPAPWRLIWKTKLKTTLMFTRNSKDFGAAKV